MAALGELQELARVLADWAAPSPHARIYLFGSRVRGDHTSESDVDVYVEFDGAGRDDVNWWITNQRSAFREIQKRLPFKFNALDPRDPFKRKIVAAPVAYQDRNVFCVTLPRDAI